MASAELMNGQPTGDPSILNVPPASVHAFGNPAAPAPAKLPPPPPLKRGDRITGVIQTGPLNPVRIGVGPVHTVLDARRFFAQLRTQKGTTHNGYFVLQDEGITWARGDLESAARSALLASSALMSR
jgi:hypothetical protein